MITALLVLARSLHIGGAMLLFALPYFSVFIVGPALAADSARGSPPLCPWMGKWFWMVLLVEAVSGGAWFWLVAAQMRGQSLWDTLDAATLNTVLWQTEFGRLWLGRAAIGLALGTAIFSAGRRKTLVSTGFSFENGLLLLLSGALLITLAWAGHAAAGTQHHVLHLLDDTLHLLIGAVWPIGLIPMACFLWHIDRRNRLFPVDREIEVLGRFSRISLIAVLLLVVTGFINGWLMIGTWEALVTTLYGRLLLGKVAVMGIMISLGALNRFYLMPRMQEAPFLFRTLRRTILAESGLALVILLIVGIMGMTSPPS